MEKEVMKRNLDLLEHNVLDVDYIVTDRHPLLQNLGTLGMQGQTVLRHGAL